MTSFQAKVRSSRLAESSFESRGHDSGWVVCWLGAVRRNRGGLLYNVSDELAEMTIEDIGDQQQNVWGVARVVKHPEEGADFSLMQQ